MGHEQIVYQTPPKNPEEIAERMCNSDLWRKVCKENGKPYTEEEWKQLWTSELDYGDGGVIK